MSFAENRKAILAQLPAGVGLVAVSKKVESERLEEALAAGQCLFGENYVQEAAAKWPMLKARYPAISLRLIGHLQSNKADAAVRIFDRIDTLDSEKLARALAAAMKKIGRQVPVLLEVNIAAEPQKGGVDVERAAALLEVSRALGLDVQGLMCIPPAEGDPGPHFHKLKELCGALGLAVCSMGMSADYTQAAACGATEVRVGTALFGARPNI